MNLTSPPAGWPDRGPGLSGPQTALLGAIAGLTIFLGLPVGRIRSLSSQMRTFLNAAAGGVLAFLVFEFFEQASEKIEATDTALRAALFVGAATMGPQLPDTTLVRWGVLLGDASYALYLVHPFAIRPLREIWKHAPASWLELTPSSSRPVSSVNVG